MNLINLQKLSIIIPMAEQEDLYQELFTDLSVLPHQTEIIVILPYAQKGTPLHDDLKKQPRIKIAFSKPGRAHQLNEGVRYARHEHLWFLHADSRVPLNTIETLNQRLPNLKNRLIFFRLKFIKGGPLLMFINEWGCLFRSHILGVPFGDQGFCISKPNFLSLNQFNPNAPYGEDHLFVWQAKQHKIKQKGLWATISTSSRKYKKNGWLKTTFQHFVLWRKQAYPQFKKLMRSKG